MQDQQRKTLQKENQEDIDSFSHGIPLKLLQNTKVDIQHLSCYLCKGILVKPVTCNHPDCFTNFCLSCYDSYSITYNQGSYEQKQLLNFFKSCPNCNKKMQKTQLPLLKNLLAEIILKCPFYASGCEQKIRYEQFFKHIQLCLFKKIRCKGCSSEFSKTEYHPHVEICQGIKIECQKCSMNIPRVYFNQHLTRECLEQQLKQKNIYMSKVENKVQELEHRINNYQLIIQKIIKGEPLQLQTQFQTSFPNNFKVNQESKEVVLQKASFNTNKQKFDFLHFYIRTPIITSSIVSLEWKIKIKSLKGNLLIGICSSLSSNSIDLVMNKFGEIKRKQINENRYRLIRKSEITFSEGDMVTFRFVSSKKSIQITNETKFIKGQLFWEQISCLGKEFYSFYSFDTLNDCLQFF